MMEKISRRRFLLAGAAGLAGLSVAGKGLDDFYSLANDVIVDKVQFGKTGLTVSRIAMGTGTVGSNKSSNQTKLGMDNFVKLARHAYDRGIRFYDMADLYGSMPYVAESIKGLPRENITLLTKLWTYDEDSARFEPVQQVLDRFRKEANTDYFDVILMHCMQRGNWSNTRKHYLDPLSRAKQDGIAKAVGVSCHNIEALAEAAESPWVDVIMVRINPFAKHMDGSPDEVNAILAKAIQNGKGVIGMKIFGQGETASEQEREQSVQFIMTQGNIHCMTLGFESIAQLDDSVARVMKHVKRPYFVVA
jgi:predicted aldo/keto reductase-like oxidoreductase